MNLTIVLLQHAYALELLRDHLKEGSHALDVGSGSGYLTACMALMVRYISNYRYKKKTYHIYIYIYIYTHHTRQSLSEASGQIHLPRK